MKRLSQSSPQRRSLLWILSRALLLDFHSTSVATIHDEAIVCLQELQGYHEQALYLQAALMMSGHVHRDNLPTKEICASSNHYNLGQIYFLRFNWLGRLRDLDNAIMSYREALNACTKSHSKTWSVEASNNRMMQMMSASNTGKNWMCSLWDLRNQFDVHSACVHLPGSLTEAYQVRFHYTKDWAGVEDIIQLTKMVQRLQSVSAASAAMYTSVSGSARLFVSSLRNKPDDFDEIIQYHKETLQTVADSDPHLHTVLRNYASAHLLRFQTSKNLPDLDDAVLLHTQALGLCLASDLDHALCLDGLALALDERY